MFPDLSFVKYTTQKIIEEIAAGPSRACLPYVSMHTVLAVLETVYRHWDTASLTLASPTSLLSMLFPLFLCFSWPSL